jgi:hypothetical protein
MGHDLSSEAHELLLFIENTGELYNQKLAILENVRRRVRNGTYDHALAPKLWMYWVDAGMRRYEKENLSKGEGPRVFPPPVRREVAAYLANEEFKVLMGGEYGEPPVRNPKLGKKAHSPNESGQEWGVVVGQKDRQRLLPRIFPSKTAAGKEADLWSDATVIPLTEKHAQWAHKIRSLRPEASPMRSMGRAVGRAMRAVRSVGRKLVGRSPTEGGHEPITPVIFRVFKPESLRQKGWSDTTSTEVIALFPTIPANHSGTDVMSYAHVGQHSAASPDIVVARTRPAKPHEYANLKRELESIGYRLKVYQRETHAMRSARIAEARRPIDSQSSPRKCPTGMHVQSILFAKDAHWTSVGAKSWLTEHGYRDDLDVTKQHIRARQAPPSAFHKGMFRTIPFSHHGIQAVVGCPKGR